MVERTDRTTATYFRCVFPKRHPTALPARQRSRWTIAGQERALFLASSADAAFSERIKYTERDGVTDWLGIVVTLAEVEAADIRLLDLTDAPTRSRFQISLESLTNDPNGLTEEQAYSECRRCFYEALKQGYDGVKAPSAAYEGANTIAIRASALERTRVLSSTTTSPPRRSETTAIDAPVDPYVDIRVRASG